MPKINSTADTNNKVSLLKQILPYVIPVIFFGYGLVCLIYFHKNLTFDGYLAITAARGLREGYGFSSMAFQFWPPLYPMGIWGLSFLVPYEFGAELISLFSACALLCILPFISRVLGGTIFSGIAIQCILVLSPEFFEFSLKAENHILNSLFYTLALYFGIRYFKEQSLSDSYLFVLFGSLASITRFPSLTVLFSFVVTLVVFRRTTPKVKHLLGLMLVFTGIYLPWSVYNYAVNEASALKYSWSIIGHSFISNGLFKFGDYYWTFHEVMNYKSLLDFIRRHPNKFILNLWLNTQEIIKHYIYKFRPLWGFSWIMGVGWVGVLITFRKTYYFFLSVASIFTGVVLTQVLVRWEYFLHIGPVLAVAGFVFITLVIQKIYPPFSHTARIEIVLFTILFLPGLIWYGGTMWSEHTNLIKNRFIRHPVKQSVSHSLEELKESSDMSVRSIRIMGFFHSLPVIYKYGFRAVFAPFPINSADETLCYTGLDQHVLSAVRRTNYPPRMPLRSYVPAEYIFLGWMLNQQVDFNGLVTLQKQHDYLAPIGKSRIQQNVSLYRINKAKLNCPE